MTDRLDRSKLILRPLADRTNRVEIEKQSVGCGNREFTLSDAGHHAVEAISSTIIRARRADRPVVMAFGAHLIKNGLSATLRSLIEPGWITHLATNGAGIIHDWEFARFGRSSEHVEQNVREGTFGLWNETGMYLNLAIIVGAYEGLGYGESIGSMVCNDGLMIPERSKLIDEIRALSGGTARTAAAADLLWAIDTFGLEQGFLRVEHPYKRFGLQSAAFELGVPFTAHPMFGHDIIYVHPWNLGAAVGRTAEADFLSFADSITRIDGGVYLSIGSAVMSPMIFEKSLAMAQNLAIQRGDHIDDFDIMVVDLAESAWDWTQGEPPADDPAYYVRFMKSFSRMGGRLTYVQADNRAFLTTLCRMLREKA
ncbi:MAG: hypothetical protein EA382_08620, partial [Spirochaetaceae bacterium]